MTAMDAPPRQNENFTASFQSPGLAAEAAAHMSSRPGESTALASAAPTAFKADSPLGAPATSGADASAKPAVGDSQAPGADSRPVNADTKTSAGDTAIASAALPGDNKSPSDTKAINADVKAAPIGTPAINGEAKALASADSKANPATPAAPDAPAAPAAKPSLDSTESNIEKSLRQNPSMEGLSNVYKELDQLQKQDGPKFGKDLDAINKKLQADGLLPGLSIIQDKYTGADGKDHNGFSMIANDKSNPHNQVGSEVSNNHPTAQQTPESSRIYHAMAQHHNGEGHGHGHHHGRHHRRHHHYDPSRDSAEGGRASHGGYDRDLTGKHVPKGDRKELIDQALKKAGIPQTAPYEAAMNKIITRESGWNTNAVNHTDINARRGDPSKGLMQVIHSTFEQYRDKSLPNSQTDPMANTVAALHYIGARYGHGDRAAGLLRVASRSGGY